MDEKNTKPLKSATGGIHIGETFLKSFQASWPFGKIEIYNDKVVLKIQYLPNFVLSIFKMLGKFPGMIGAYKTIPKHIYLAHSTSKYNSRSHSPIAFERI